MKTLKYTSRWPTKSGWYWVRLRLWIKSGFTPWRVVYVSVSRRRKQKRVPAIKYRKSKKLDRCVEFKYYCTLRYWPASRHSSDYQFAGPLQHPRAADLEM